MKEELILLLNLLFNLYCISSFRYIKKNQLPDRVLTRLLQLKISLYFPFSDIVPPTETSFIVAMSPWSNYTFRVIARNKVGESLPSGHSKTCLTPEDVPYKNPDNVEGRGTEQGNIVIYWTVR